MIRLVELEACAGSRGLETVQYAIDSTQDALRNNDNSKALQEPNSADSEVLKNQSASKKLYYVTGARTEWMLTDNVCLRGDLPQLYS
jgi:hypothetical protein